LNAAKSEVVELKSTNAAQTLLI